MTYEPENLKLWTSPNSYFGDNWSNYYVFLSRNRDSDDLSESNFECGLKAIGGESETVKIVCANHWAVGWVEWIAIDKSDENALRLADDIAEKLSNYPILDESDFSEREQETATRTWSRFNYKERLAYIRKNRDQFDYCDFEELMAQVRGKYFGGYAPDLVA